MITICRLQYQFHSLQLSTIFTTEEHIKNMKEMVFTNRRVRDTVGDLNITLCSNKYFEFRPRPKVMLKKYVFEDYVNKTIVCFLFCFVLNIKGFPLFLECVSTQNP